MRARCSASALRWASASAGCGGESGCDGGGSFPRGFIESASPGEFSRLSSCDDSPLSPSGPSDGRFGSSRSEEHTSELQSLMRISYAVFCLKKKKNKNTNTQAHNRL